MSTFSTFCTNLLHDIATYEFKDIVASSSQFNTRLTPLLQAEVSGSQMIETETVELVRETLSALVFRLPNTPILPRSSIETALLAAGRACLEGKSTPVSLAVLELGLIDVSNIRISGRISNNELACLVSTYVFDPVLHEPILRLAKHGLNDELSQLVFARFVEMIQTTEMSREQLENVACVLCDLGSKWWPTLLRKQAMTLNERINVLIAVLGETRHEQAHDLFRSIILSNGPVKERIAMLTMAKDLMTVSEFDALVHSVITADNMSEMRAAAVAHMAHTNELKASVLYDPASSVRVVALQKLTGDMERNDLLPILGLKLRDKAQRVRDVAMTHIDALLRQSNDVPADFVLIGLRQNQDRMHDYLVKNIHEIFDGTFKLQ